MSAGLTPDSKPVAKKSSDKTSAKDDMDVDPRVGSRLVAEARKWLGVPYRYGRDTKSGTDCSGMVSAVYRDVAGIKLPRSSAEQAQYCVDISKSSLQPGDLVFFNSSSRGGRISHVGLYVGDGKMIHATASRGVIESDLAEKYYDTHYHSSGRVYGVTLAATGGKHESKSNPEAKLVQQPEPQAATDPATVAKKAVKEVTLDEFVASHPSSPDNSNDSDNSNNSENSNNSDTAKVVSQPVSSAAAPADSVRRADAIRRDVTKAMRFGK